jgi:hypothetical protein
VEMKTRLQKLKKKGYDGGYWWVGIEIGVNMLLNNELYSFNDGFLLIDQFTSIFVN